MIFFATPITSGKDCDEFAIRSQTTWGQANEKGIFTAEMAPIEISTKKGTKVRACIISYTCHSTSNAE
jgi:acetyl-CoA acetyltransferase